VTWGLAADSLHGQSEESLPGVCVMVNKHHTANCPPPWFRPLPCVRYLRLELGSSADNAWIWGVTAGQLEGSALRVILWRFGSDHLEQLDRVLAWQDNQITI